MRGKSGSNTASGEDWVRAASVSGQSQSGSGLLPSNASGVAALGNGTDRADSRAWWRSGDHPILFVHPDSTSPLSHFPSSGPIMAGRSIRKPANAPPRTRYHELHPCHLPSRPAGFVEGKNNLGCPPSPASDGRIVGHPPSWQPP
jgi:hypothetical protein